MLLNGSEDKPSKRRPHILVECPELIASVRVGVLDPLLLGNGQRFDVRFTRTIDVGPADLVWADILITVRGCEQMTLQIVKEAKRLHRLIVYYLDDDLLHMPEDCSCYASFRDNGQDKTMRDILWRCDVLWGVNLKIRDQYLPLCGGQRWIHNRVPTTIPVSVERQPSEQIQILYAGSSDHEKSIRQFITPAVVNICKRFEGRVHFTFVGADPGIRNNPHVTYHRYFDDYNAYRDFVLRGGFSIAMAIVRLENFFQCKYYNKFIEYTAIGAVGIYTDCDLYRQIICDGENGILCENTVEGWENAIIRLAEDSDLRCHCLDNAQTLIRTQFQPEYIFQDLLVQMPEFDSYYAPECTVAQVRLSNMKMILIKDRIKNLFRRYKLLAIPIIGYKALKKLCKIIRKVLLYDR